MAKQNHDGLPFCELTQEALHNMRGKLGLQEWVIGTTTGEVTGS